MPGSFDVFGNWVVAPPGGIVLKDTAGNQWLVTPSTSGVLGAVAYGTTPPVQPPNMIQIGANTYALSGTNIPRLASAAVQYTYSANQTVSPANQYGYECVVSNSTGLVTSINDRYTIGAGSTATTIPSTGYVLSGHDPGVGTTSAGYWLRQYATVGAAVKLYYAPQIAPPPGSGTARTYPAKAVSIYKMMWSNSGAFPTNTLPTNCNVIRLAFAQGDPPVLTGYGPEGQSTFLSQLATARTAGVRIILSVGGAGGALNVLNRPAFVNGVLSINSVVGLDGIDWDLEGPSMAAADILAIAQSLAASALGNAFAHTMVPNGSVVAQYLPVAKVLQDNGFLSEYGQQFYDAPVSQSAADSRIVEAINYGIPESKISVGMMIANDSSHWTNAQCLANYNYLRGLHPTLKGAYLWEGSRAGTTQWASEVGAAVLA